ncbi:unnamed protein product [Eruca vesicaria subsp. sativa]|uniref:Uncharacterized protein n=1 Tax=Eruca vesicaria subsp. sativa TaxID=29727 RepID=A0ABC8KD82_ERUVS|nr:unnamed protein product [Eruca vesicaria subsp. sativa]
MGLFIDEKKKMETNPKRETTQIMTAMARSPVVKQVGKFASGFKWISFGYLAYCITASSRLRKNSSELDRALAHNKAKLIKRLNLN